MRKIVYIFLIVHCTMVIDNCLSQWVLKSNGMGNQTILSLVVKGNKLFAGTNYHGIFVSSDLGESWTHTSLDTFNIRTLYSDGQNIYAGTIGNNMYISHDDGVTWDHSLLTVPGISCFASVGNKIYAGTNFYGLQLSEDQGATWTKISFNLLFVYSILIRPDKMLTGNYDIFHEGLYTSTDGGIMWDTTLINYTRVNKLAENGNRIFAGTDDRGILISDDNGINWVQSLLSGKNISGIFVFEDYIFAGTYQSGLYVSHNNGLNWEPKNGGLTVNASIDDVVKQQKFIFLATHTGVYRSHLNDILSIQPVSSEIPGQYSLSQNYPNPFNPSTKIKFMIPPSSSVAQTFVRPVGLSVYDLLGREVTTLVNEELKPGTYEVEWNASHYPSGVYFYKLTSADFTETRKMVLLK